MNKTILVEGSLSFFYLSIEDIAHGWKWNYRLRSNGAEFWLWWEPDLYCCPSYDGMNAIVIGVVKQTTIYILGSSTYKMAYYIDAEKIIPI